MPENSSIFNSEAGRAYAEKSAALVPMVIEQTARGERAMDIFSRLHQERIVCVFGPIETGMAGVICAQLMELDQKAPGKPITMYINSPGGQVTAGLAIFDTMQSLKSQVNTVGMGLCASMGSFLLTAGKQRFALPNTEIMTHQPSGGFQGQATDIGIHAEVIQRTKERLRRYYMHRSDLDRADFNKIYERDSFYNATVAQKLGLIDKVIFKANPNATLSKDEQEMLNLANEINMLELTGAPEAGIPPQKELMEIIQRREERMAARAAANDAGKPASSPTAMPG